MGIKQQSDIPLIKHTPPLFPISCKFEILDQVVILKYFYTKL